LRRVPLPLQLDSYQVTSSLFSTSRCLNWIPTVAESQSLSQHYLAQPPGITEIASLVGLFRGAIALDLISYFVQDNTFARLEIDDTVTVLNVAITGNQRVSMATNGRFIVIVADIDSFVFDSVTQLVTQITDVDFRQASQVVFKDGFFVFSAADGDAFFNSALNDPFSYNALDFGSAEISPDQIVGLHVNRNELFVLGEETIELFQNVGGAGFPFVRVPGGNIQKGVYAKNSIIEFDNTFCFIGGGLNERAAIWRVTSSNSVNKISTNAIDFQLQKLSSDEIANAFSMTYQIDGQFIAIFNVGTNIFCYNATASTLLGRSVWFEMDWSVGGIVRRLNQSIIYSTENLIGVFDRSVLQFGQSIRREMISQPFYGNDLPIFEGEFEVLMQTGLVLGTDNPIVRYSYSDNGGKTFTSEFERRLGLKGEYEERIVWRRQGMFPITRVVKIEITDNVECNVMGMSATVEQGTS